MHLRLGHIGYSNKWTSKLRDAGLDGRAQVAKDKAAGDLTIIDWPVSERAKFRKIAVEAWNAAAAFYYKNKKPSC